jgi:hypothetical protein
MKQIVINKIHGGFNLSHEALTRLCEIKGTLVNQFNIARDDADLLTVVKEMGDKADGLSASLTIVEIPDDVEWQIEEYDGIEWVAEKHRTWGQQS